jgi:hypothetical protein
MYRVMYCYTAHVQVTSNSSVLQSRDTPHDATQETQFSATSVYISLLGSSQQTNGLPGW